MQGVTTFIRDSREKVKGIERHAAAVTAAKGESVESSDKNSDQEIEVGRKGALAIITLNRPRALNALTLEMIRVMSARLTAWAADDTIEAVLIRGAGDRAFCAGGDIKAAYYAGMAYRRGNARAETVSLFFGEEYLLNRQMFHYPKPLIAFMDGITMGGGYGVAGPCRFRLATEKTIFAMPEVGIGFFPDVGSVYFLTRAPGQAGMFLALTGRQVGAADMVYGGLASHYVTGFDANRMADVLAEGLSRAAGAQDSEHALRHVLDGISGAPPAPGVIERHRRELDHSFGQHSVEGILQSLRGNGSAWAQETAAAIESRSPVSLKVTFEYMRRAAGWGFDEVMDVDFSLAQHFIAGHDYYEGVRAAVIDKDRQPRWDIARLENVTDEMTSRYFQKAPRSLSDVAA